MGLITCLDVTEKEKVTCPCMESNPWLYVGHCIYCLDKRQELVPHARTWTNTVGYATTNECYNEQFLSIKSGCYNERGGILLADVARACAWRVGPSCLIRASVINLLSFVRFSYQFSSVICLFVQWINVKYVNFVLFLHLYFWCFIIFFLFKWFCWMVM